MGYVRLKVLATLLRSLLLPVSYAQTRADSFHSGDVRREKIRLPSRDPGRALDAFLYSPPVGYKPATPLPVLVNWHSSGFVVPSLGTDGAFCAFIARELGICVLDADYRKAPEHPFPAAYDDMEDVMAWVTRQPAQFDPTSICVSGFSAGGTLALEASALSDTVKAVIALYPTTDVSLDPKTKSAPRPRNEIPAAMQNFFWDCYVPDVTMRTDPRISPAYLDPAAFPPHVAIITCDGDSLQPEGNRLAQTLDDGSRCVMNITLEGVGHGFDKGAKDGTHEMAVRQYTYHKIADFLGAVLEE